MHELCKGFRYMQRNDELYAVIQYVLGRSQKQLLDLFIRTDKALDNLLASAITSGSNAAATMAAAANSTRNKPTTESTQQPAAPTRYTLKDSLEKLEAKCSIAAEEFIISMQKPNPNQSMKESLLAPAACKETNIDATPHAPSSDHHIEHMRTSKGYSRPLQKFHHPQMRHLLRNRP